MENQITPRKRENLPELSDKVHALKSAITFKLSIESQIKTQNKIVSIMTKPSLWEFLLNIVAYQYGKERSLKRKLEVSKMRADNQVKEKLKNSYHNNELKLEDEFENIYGEMAERFDNYYSRLLYFYNNYDSKSDIPYEDVQVLVVKHNKTPPVSKTDKLSFYLSMESTLHRCINS